MFPPFIFSSLCCRIIVVLGIFTAMHGRCQADEKSDFELKIRRGLQALHQQDYDTARELFASILDSEPSGAQRGRAHFYVGLSNQLEANQLGEERPEQQRDLFLEAKQAFEEAVKLLPDSGGAWNNLGLVAVQLKQDRDARQAFLNAIRTKTPEQTTYLVNYADLLSSNQQFDDAARFYHAAISQNPFHPKARAALDGYYLNHARDRLLDFLWSLYFDGRADWSLQLAINALQQSADGSEDEPLLTVAVRSLAKQQYDPASFADTEYGRQFDALKQRRELRTAVVELFSLHAGATAPAKYSWWRDRVNLDPDVFPPRGGWPQEAFTQLSRSLGRWYEQHGDPARAEQYYRFAYQLNDDHLDPHAIIDLANLWISREQTGALRAFMRAEEPRIFIEKGAAIHVRRYERMYGMHRALAIVYMHLDQWTSEQPFHNAEQQIQMALRAAERFNRHAQRDGRSERIAEWQLADHLADRYAATNRRDDAFALRVQHAEQLQDADCLEAAAQLFRPIAEAGVPAGVNKTISDSYQELKAAYQDGTLAPSSLEASDGAARIERFFVPEWRTSISVAVPRDLQVDMQELRRALGEIRILSGNPESRNNETGGREAPRSLPVELVPENAPLLRAEFDGRRGNLELDQPGRNIRVPFEIPAGSPRLDRAPLNAIRP